MKDKAYRATSWLPSDLAGLRQDHEALRLRSREGEEAARGSGLSRGFEFEWTTSQNESWGLPIVEAVIPMLARVGIKVKVKQVEVAVLTELGRKGEFQAYVLFQQPGLTR